MSWVCTHAGKASTLVDESMSAIPMTLQGIIRRGGRKPEEPKELICGPMPTSQSMDEGVGGNKIIILLAALTRLGLVEGACLRLSLTMINKLMISYVCRLGSRAPELS